MNALMIHFKTGRFNLSEVGEHFINSCCFGEDLAAWLRERLCERQVETREPYQEDWGWELPVKSGDQSYYLCMSGNADSPNGNSNEGEWAIIVEKKRSIWQSIASKGKIAENDPMVRLVDDVLRGEPTFRDVRFEES